MDKQTAYTQQGGQGGAMQSTACAFKTAMNAMDVATRPSVSEILEPDQLRDVFSELSYIAQVLLSDYDSRGYELERVKADLDPLRHEHRKLSHRFEARQAERDSMEELWIRAKMDAQDIAEQANELNTELWNTKRMLRSAESRLETLSAALAESRDSHKQLEESFLEVSQERNAAFSERDDAKAHAADLKGGLEEARSHIVKLRTLAHKRREVLNAVASFLKSLPSKQKTEACLTLMDNVAEARQAVDYATYQPCEAVSAATSEPVVTGPILNDRGLISTLDPSHPYHKRTQDDADHAEADAASLAAYEAAKALNHTTGLLKRMHEWEDVATDDGVQTVCKFCGIAQDNADELALQNPEAATFCLETGINVEAENTTLAEVIAAQ